MDPLSFQHAALMGEPRSTLSKGERMEYRDGVPTHAMLILGYHISPAKSGGAMIARSVGTRRRRGGVGGRRRRAAPPRKRSSRRAVAERWRVENSWGEKGAKKGALVMSKEWFDEHVYSIVVPRSYVRSEWTRAQAHVVQLEPWDIFGNLFA